MTTAMIALLSSSTQTTEVSPVYSIFSLICSIIELVAIWKIFVKAGEAGWKCLIPIYDAYIFFKIVYGNGWKFLLMLVPILNIVLAIAYNFRLAKCFGKGVGFGFGLLLLSPIFSVILGFDDSQYQGPHDGFI